MQLITGLNRYECPICYRIITEERLNHIHECVLEIEDIYTSTGESMISYSSKHPIPRRMEDYLTIRCPGCTNVVVLRPSKEY